MSAGTDKSRTTYALLEMFLGTLGIHSFYIGRTWNGILNLLVTIGLGWTGLIAVTATVHFFVGLIWLFRSDTAFYASLPK